MLAERFDAFLFDLDGVVHLGDRSLPHARESLAHLRDGGKEIRFLTNDPRPTRAKISRRLTGMEIRARVEEIVTSSWATAEHLCKNRTRSAYVVGSPGLETEIRRAGVEVVASGRPEAVVVGAEERTSYRHVEQAARFARGGARFVATNPDGFFPTPEGHSPGVGAIVAPAEVAAGRRPGARAPGKKRGGVGSGLRCPDSFGGSPKGTLAGREIDRVTTVSSSFEGPPRTLTDLIAALYSCFAAKVVDIMSRPFRAI